MLVAMLREHLDRLQAIFRGDHAIAFASQDLDAEVAEHLFILDEQDRLRRAS